MAEHVCFFPTANGKQIKGDSTQTSLGRQDCIECLSYEQAGATPFEPSTGQASGRRQYTPLKITKRIDKASPLLWQAMTQNQKVEGVFKFYRPNPTGDGTTEQFFSVQIGKGFIASIRQFVEDTLAPTESYEPPMEELTLIFHEIQWTYTNGGVQHEDKWSES